jgi:hypothetical protein
VSSGTRFLAENTDMTSTSILSRMRADHRRVLRDLLAVEDGTPALGTKRGKRPRRSPRDWIAMCALRARLDRQFATHMVAEEEALFPSLELALPETRPILALLRTEHAELRAMLAGLGALLDDENAAGRDEQLVVQWLDFAALLRIHIRREEAAIFGVAERILPPRELARVEARRFPAQAAARSRNHPTNGKEIRP